MFLWGSSGHVQTVVFGAGVTRDQVEGERFCVVAADGSTIYYDVFEPDFSQDEQRCGQSVSLYTFFVVPGKLVYVQRQYLN